jgi:hypothetical protein
MTRLSYAQLLAFLKSHPHGDMADIGGDPSLDFAEIDAPRVLYNITDGLDICNKPLPKIHDTVISMDLFEHIVDPVRASENIVRSIGVGGWLFLTTVFVFHKHDYPIDMYRYTDTALNWLFRDLRIERCWMESEPESLNGQRVSIIGQKP